MKIISDYNYTEFRYPTSEELIQVSKYFEVYYRSLIKLVKAFRTIFCAAGLFLFGSLGFNSEVSLISIAVGIICFVIVFICIKTKNDYINIIMDFKKGNFVVMDGKISKIEMNPDNRNCINVWFTSLNNGYSEGWLKIRKEFAELGSSIILVYLNSTDIKKCVRMAFTPFMLTEDGIKLQK